MGKLRSTRKGYAASAARLNPCIASYFTQKRPNFVSLLGRKRGRGNLKAKGMASRGEAQEQKPIKSQSSDLSHRNTAIATFLGRYIIRPQGCISFAGAYIMQPLAVYHYAADGRPPLLRASFRDAALFRQRLPRRAQKCALLAMTRRR